MVLIRNGLVTHRFTFLDGASADPCRAPCRNPTPSRDILLEVRCVTDLMPHRLGDDIDDFCIKCKRLTNHSIVSLVDERAAKVRCRTCYHDHDFRNEEPLPSKKDLKKAALFEEVLKGAGGAGDADPDAGDEDDPELAGIEGESPNGDDDGDVAPPAPAPKKTAKKAAKKK
jgi:hypothetical protein